MLRRCSTARCGPIGPADPAAFLYVEGPRAREKPSRGPRARLRASTRRSRRPEPSLDGVVRRLEKRCRRRAARRTGRAAPVGSPFGGRVFRGRGPRRGVVLGKVAVGTVESSLALVAAGETVERRCVGADRFDPTLGTPREVVVGRLARARWRPSVATARHSSARRGRLAQARVLVGRSAGRSVGRSAAQRHSHRRQFYASLRRLTCMHGDGSDDASGNTVCRQLSRRRAALKISAGGRLCDVRCGDAGLPAADLGPPSEADKTGACAIPTRRSTRLTSGKPT